jgi:hypothetical protein
MNGWSIKYCPSSKDEDISFSSVQDLGTKLALEHEESPSEMDIESEHTVHDPARPVTEHREGTLVVLDGANIGWFFGKTQFSARGISNAISYFEHLSTFNVVCFLPTRYLRAKPLRGDSSLINPVMETDDTEILDRLWKTDKLSLVPSCEEDDLYIIGYAFERGGFIVSNDLFADHIRSIEVEQKKMAFFDWLQTHRCGYTFVHDGLVVNPDSLLGLHCSRQYT